MMTSANGTPTKTITDPDDIGDIETAATFLRALFPVGSLVTVRPVKAWTESTKKKTSVDYKGITTITVDDYLEGRLKRVFERAANCGTNVFFGCAPRFRHRLYEKAWQIRSVTFLWADDDSGDLPAAKKKFGEVGLPEPSVIVSTGRGHHFYWLIDVPFLIDDVGDPPAVRQEWFEIGGKKKPIDFYVNQFGDKVWLQDQKTGQKIASAVPKLSEKAMFIQDINAGIAVALDSDHTHDLARQFRIPGPPNRKGLKNGEPTKPTALLENNGVRYTINQFAKFVEKSPLKKQRERAAAMPLPSVKKLSPKRGDDLSQRIASCVISEDRSRADFALCCWAIKNSVDQEELWRQVESKGKFAERGRDYFDMTWNKSADKTRCDVLEKIEKQNDKQQSPENRRHIDYPTSDDDSTTPAIIYSPSTMPVRTLFDQITSTFAESGQVFTRAGQPVCINGDDLTPMVDQPTVAALLCGQRELIIEEIRGESITSEFVPLPGKYANPWLRDGRQHAKLPVITLYTRAPVFRMTSKGWGLAPSGFDQESGIYYAGPDIKPAMGTEHLDVVLKEFCWKRPADRTNYIAMALTIVTMPRFIGAKPGVIGNGNQPGVGKTMAMQGLAVMQGGKQVSTITYNERDEELEKRLGSIVKSGVQTLIIDNAKTAGNRTAEISSPIVERSITDNPVSFRLLGSSLDIRAENSFIVAITANSEHVCRDLVSRCIPISLYFEGDATQRSFNLPDLLGYVESHRFEILAELLGMVQRWIDAGCPLSKVRTRFESKSWASIIGGILETCGEPDFLSNTEEMSEELDPVRGEFGALVELIAQMTVGVEWTSAELVRVAKEGKVLAEQLEDGSERSQSTRMGKLISRFIGKQFSVTDPAGRAGRCDVVLRSSERRAGPVYFLRRP